MRKEYKIGILVILFVLILDQAIKIWTKLNFAPGDESVKLIGNWFQFTFVENQGMAFGTTLGSGIWAKLLLSSLRVVLISAIIYYFIQQVRAGVRLGFLVCLSFIIAGAIGNLIDSLCYDFIFKFDPCNPYNESIGSGIKVNCKQLLSIKEVRSHGFLQGNVVDMFQFVGTWPSWVPWVGGSELFPAIWNVADGSITLGVVWIIIRQRAYFPKVKVSKSPETVVQSNDNQNTESPENNDEKINQGTNKEE